MQENINIKKTDKNTIFDKRTVEISSERPGNYPGCVLLKKMSIFFRFLHLNPYERI